MRTFAAAALLACCVPVVSQAAITIQNGYLQVGVSDQGTLGSDNSTEPGILYDPTGSGTYGTADFLTPGTPYEGFKIKIGGTTYTANNDSTDYPSSYGTFTLTPVSATSATAQATSTDGAITVLNTYTLGTLGGAPAINVSTKITNSSASTLTGVEFLRILDPDQDSDTHGTYKTNNSVLSNKEVCAAGPVSGATVCLSSTGVATGTVNAGDGESTDPDVYLAGENGGNGDFYIGLAYDLGNLAAGASVTITYAYAFSLVPPPLSVPAPTLGLGALYLLGALLSLVAWLNRATMARMVRRSLGS